MRSATSARILALAATTCLIALGPMVSVTTSPAFAQVASCVINFTPGSNGFATIDFADTGATNSVCVDAGESAGVSVSYIGRGTNFVEVGDTMIETGARANVTVGADTVLRTLAGELQGRPPSNGRSSSSAELNIFHLGENAMISLGDHSSFSGGTLDIQGTGTTAVHMGDGGTADVNSINLSGERTVGVVTGTGSVINLGADATVTSDSRNAVGLVGMDSQVNMAGTIRFTASPKGGTPNLEMNDKRELFNGAGIFLRGGSELNMTGGLISTAESHFSAVNWVLSDRDVALAQPLQTSAVANPFTPDAPRFTMTGGTIETTGSNSHGVFFRSGFPEIDGVPSNAVNPGSRDDDQRPSFMTVGGTIRTTGHNSSAIYLLNDVQEQTSVSEEVVSRSPQTNTALQFDLDKARREALPIDILEGATVYSQHGPAIRIDDGGGIRSRSLQQPDGALSVKLVVAGKVGSGADFKGPTISLGAGHDVVSLLPTGQITGTVDGGLGTNLFLFEGEAGSVGTANADTMTLLNFNDFAKIGKGTWNFTGDATGFEEEFEIREGQLNVNGNYGDTLFAVRGGATLGGSGIVGDTTIDEAAILAPGNSIGTLKSTGIVQFAIGSGFLVEVSSDGTSDKLESEGEVVIDGGTVAVKTVTADANFADGKVYEIITAKKGVQGTFERVIDESDFLDFKLGYSANAVTLTTEQTQTFNDVAQDPNQSSIAAALESFDRTDGTDSAFIVSALLGLSEEEARSAFDQIGGEAHTGSVASVGAAGSSFGNTLFGQSGSGGGGTFALAAPQGAAGNSVSAIAEFYASGRSGIPGGALKTVNERVFAADVLVDEAPQTSSLGPSVWFSGFGGKAEVDGDGNASGYESTGGGVTGGIETALNDFVNVGLALGWSRSHTELTDITQQSEADNYHLGAYANGGASRLENGINWRAATSYTWHDISAERTIAFGAVNRTANSNTDGYTITGTGELRYNRRVNWNLPGATVLAPLARIDIAHSHVDGFTETGANALNLTVADQTRTNTWLGAGLAIGGSYDLGAFTWNPNWTIAYERNVGDDRSAATMSLAGSQATFGVTGPRESRDRLRLTSSSDFKLSEQAKFTISTESSWSEDRTEWGAKGTLTFRF